MVGPPPGSGAAPPPTPAPHKALAPAGSEIPMMRQAPATDPRTARPARASFLEGAVEKLAGALFTRKHASYANVDHPLLRQIALEQVRLNKLVSAEQTLTVDAEQNVAGEISHLQGAIRMAGIDPNSFVSQAHTAEAMGGPLIPLSTSSFTGVLDAAFNEHVAQIAEELDQLTGIARAMRSVPLTMPVQGEDFHRSSGFGARIDPFTKRWAFHAGLDFTGPFGSTIHATAPGIVVYAGPRGPYGNAVEIDHGMGIRTRYGHMSAILVQPGTKVEKGSPIGKLGSSGRSTGPHVHYEVWYDQAARDPARFIEAGRYVLKE
jgi:murein DD-endopeptidase MepM/ murein hydrolase activator NlpD